MFGGQQALLGGNAENESLLRAFFNIVDVTQTVWVQSFFGTAGRVMLSTVCIHTRRKSAQW